MLLLIFLLRKVLEQLQLTEEYWIALRNTPVNILPFNPEILSAFLKETGYSKMPLEFTDIRLNLDAWVIPEMQKTFLLTFRKNKLFHLLLCQGKTL